MFKITQHWYIEWEKRGTGNILIIIILLIQIYLYYKIRIKGAVDIFYDRCLVNE